MKTPNSVDKAGELLEKGKHDFYGGFGGGRMSLWRKFAIAVTVATLLYGGQIRLHTNDLNRFFSLWERSDGLSIIAGVILLAALFTLGRELLARTRFRRVADHGFVFLLGGAAISNFVRAGSFQPELLYLALAAGVAVSWVAPRYRLPYRSAQVALIFSPLAAILGWQLLAYPEWGTPRETPAQRFPARVASPIFVFIFDEWSYDRSTVHGALIPGFDNLGKLAEQSFVFHDARSPDDMTQISVSRFLFQTMDQLEIGPGQTFWEGKGKRVPTAESPSLFNLAREYRYNSSMLGFYIPQRRVLGGQADYVDIFNHDPKARTFAGRIVENAVRNLEFWSDSASRRFRKTIDISTTPGSRTRISEHWKEIFGRLRSESLALFKRAPLNTFAVMHFPLPHAPFIFNADGSYIGPFQGQRMSDDPEGYMRHLGFLDVVIGELIDELKASGKFEQSMIVITSDHSWRADPRARGKPPKELLHVPLFIKLPGQHESVPISEKFHLTGLRPVIENVMSGHVGEADATMRRLAR